ncbi:MAG: uracil-DNA glycosylase [Gammaproteobacteria bacterium RIFCSPHIGHO2_12_FULL_42_10]|nr:MAG: uracil-DNA glycosylase [Gammaproteobacteria bacterium RIFCSPHIGHO2_12_FULL_42_10]
MSATTHVKIATSWLMQLGDEFDKPYMQILRKFLLHEKQAKKIIYPQGNQIFNAFNLTPFDEVKVVIFGQDPYHGPNQAHGLCFSVMPGVRIPPSLKNIYTELANDLHIAPAKHGYLESWAKQGVLLLNTVLTVEQGKAYSHQGKGWEQFTDQVIIRLNARQKPIIFILWGKHAENKSKYIDQNRHYVLKSAHPSPLSAHQGFFGNKHFSKINKILASEAMESIHWELPEIEKVANRR